MFTQSSTCFFRASPVTLKDRRAASKAGWAAGPVTFYFKKGDEKAAALAKERAEVAATAWRERTGIDFAANEGACL